MAQTSKQTSKPREFNFPSEWLQYLDPQKIILLTCLRHIQREQTKDPTKAFSCSQDLLHELSLISPRTSNYHIQKLSKMGLIEVKTLHGRDRRMKLPSDEVLLKKAKQLKALKPLESPKLSKKPKNFKQKKAKK